jgi:hypothetical protein
MPERSEAGIVSRIARKVASERETSARAANRSQIPAKAAENHGIRASNSYVFVTPP